MDFSAIISAGKMASDSVASMLYTLIGKDGTAAQTNIYMPTRTERADRQREAAVKTLLAVVAIVLLAMLVIWIAKKPKN